ncbi:MAG: hypothetical protein DRO40_08130 [Thermoprotei archaeon]|nr:MAG: hypothetical protein DRO40_08130 [Thermoprotei archaeon]
MTMVVGDRILVRNRVITRESDKRFEIYLPMNNNDLWEKLSESRVKVDVIIKIRDRELAEKILGEIL